MISRRRLLTLASSAVASGACSAWAQRSPSTDGRLSVSFKSPTRSIASGTHALGLGSDNGRDGLLIVPASYKPETATPMAVMLHGAGGSARRVTSLFSVADELGIILFSPESRGGTWDGIREGYGPDIDFLNLSLGQVFDRCKVDKRRLAIGGFSDGASYGLSVGLANGDLFTHIVACSPGFIIPRGAMRGRPRVFISHGRADRILPIDSTSRRIVPELERGGYAVKYREFDGPHSVPPEIAREALTWFVGA